MNYNKKKYPKLTIRNIAFFICFLCLPATILSQNTKIDSLKTELAKNTTNDTIRANVLYELAFSYYQKDISLTNKYLSEAEKLNSTLNFKKGNANVLYLKGILENRTSNYSLGITYFQQSLEIFESIKDSKGIASIYNALGVTYFMQSDYEEALKFFDKSIEIYEKMDNEQKMINSILNVGNIYAEIGNYPEAILNYKNVLTITRKHKNDIATSYALSNLGNVYEDMGNIPLALEYYKKGLYQKEQMGDSLGMSRTLNNIGIAYARIKNYGKALDFHNRSLEIASIIKNKSLIGKNKENIGTIYKNKKEFIKALKLINESLNIATEINDERQISVCLSNIGEIYVIQNKLKLAREHFEKAIDINNKLGDQLNLSKNFLGVAETYFKEQEFDKALSYTIKGEKIANEINTLNAQHKAKELLFMIYEKTNNYEKALESHQQYKILSDSLLNEENIKKIAEIEYEYKYKKELDDAGERELTLTKTVETTTQDLEKSQRKLLLGIIIFLTIAMVLGSIIFFLKLRNSKAKTEHIITEQKLLRSQMTPHFIFNSLSVLQGMILNKEESKSVSYLSKFSKLLRITLENSRDKTVLLSQELEAVDNYLSLQNIENEKINFKLSVDDTIETNTIKVPPMLIQPFVENAIEHAFRNQKEDCSIEISLTLVDSELICIVLDNGIGINSSERNSNQNKKSLATKITSERLQYLSKDFKMKGSVTIEDRSKYNEQGTKVTIQIPFIKEEAQ